ncbi:MAG TPA: hypothetical protein VK589_17670, partial [Chryseolinea sp.]|nr:hypothetical protein [Chryseolinea sp.]
TVPNSGTGSSGTNRKTGFVAAMLFCVSNIRHNPIFSLVQGVQLRMTVLILTTHRLSTIVYLAIDSLAID